MTKPEPKLFDHIEYLMRRKMDEELDIKVENDVDINEARVMINAVNALRVAMNEILDSETFVSQNLHPNERVGFIVQLLALLTVDRLLTYTKTMDRNARRTRPTFLLERFMEIFNSAIAANKEEFKSGKSSKTPH